MRTAATPAHHIEATAAARRPDRARPGGGARFRGRARRLLRGHAAAGARVVEARKSLLMSFNPPGPQS
jgi:hypothetical protein